jgi:exodeoxyribonuclease-3
VGYDTGHPVGQVAKRVRFRVVTLNCNGIRSAASKGLFDWLSRQRADVVCLQETKAQAHQLGDEFRPKGWHCHYYDAVKKGYAGTALLSRRAPDEVRTGFGVDEFDAEGRWLEARFGKLCVVSLYAPSGSAGPERQASKDRFLDAFLPFMQKLKRSGRDYLVCGDWNIAHRNIDLKNWRSNQKNSGFLPHERAFLDRLFDEVGWVDAFRKVDPRPDQYTWWSNRGQAWAKNVGWRIDYQVATPSLGERVEAARIYKDQRFSDHAPLIMDYGL